MKNLSSARILYGGLFLCTLVSGVFPQRLLSIIVLFILFGLFLINDLNCVLPFMLFYYSVYGVVFGVSVFRLFSLLVIARYVINRNFAIKKSLVFIPMMIYVIYTLFVFSWINFQQALFNLVSIFAVLIITRNVFSEEYTTKRFFSIYGIIALFSYVTGLITNNILTYSEMMSGGYFEMNRFMATFEDPNYMGFFFMIAIFSIISLKLYTKTIRVLIVVALSVILFSSFSMTAFVGYLAMWIVYLFFGKKINIRTALLLFAVLATLTALLYTGVLDSIPYFRVFLNRILYKYAALRNGDVLTVTSNRTTHFAEHLNYFAEQPFIYQLIGGNFVTPFGSNLPIASKAMAHNEYIDLLLNVGIIGEILLLGYFGCSLISHIRNLRKQTDELILVKVLVKFIWLYYAFSLTIFMDFRFVFPYLL